jgi:hypothetical protein
MIGRALGAPLVAVALAIAPLQCPQSNDPAHCWDEAPGDGLWDLAQRFQANHDEASARATLAFLVERYPSSRYAPAARDALARNPDAGAPLPQGP